LFGKVPGVVADPFRRGRSRSAWLSWRLTSGGGRAAFSLSANSRGTRWLWAGQLSCGRPG